MRGLIDDRGNHSVIIRFCTSINILSMYVHCSMNDTTFCYMLCINPIYLHVCNTLCLTFTDESGISSPRTGLPSPSTLVDASCGVIMISFLILS